MKRPQLVSQGSLQRMLQAANEAWQRGDFQQHFELLERASNLDPANARILLRLGQSYGLRYDYATAERYFEKAVRVASNKTETLVTAGWLLIDFARYQLAEHFFQQASEQKDASADSFARLAELHERLHRNQDATAMIERALHLDDSCPLACITQAKLHRRAGRLVEAEQSLRPTLTATNRQMRIRGLYELGTILDRQGRYDEAMTAFLEAKSLLAPEAPPFIAQIKRVRAHLDEMLANISASTLQRWHDFNTALQPSHRLALLCGHPRSGTTLLEQTLNSHSEIVSAEETEIFQTDAYRPLGRNLPQNASMLTILEGAPPEAIRQARDRYFSTIALHLGQHVDTRLLIDKNPSYNALIPAFVRIFPETKFLVALRDPRDVCLSCFMQVYVPLDRSGALGLTLETTVEGYARVMGLWRFLRPLLRNSWLEIRYEDMVEDLESAARRTLDFLGVPWDARVLRYDEHAQRKPVRSNTYADVTQPVYKRAVARWRNYQKYLEPHLTKLEPFIKAFGYE